MVRRDGPVVTDAVASRRSAVPSSELADLGDRVTRVAWSPDGSGLAASSLSGRVVVLLDDGPPLELPWHPSGALDVAWSPDGRVASGGQDGVVRVVTTDGVAEAEVRGVGWCQRVAWAPGGPDCLAAAIGRELVLLVDGGVERHEDASTVADLAWSVDGRRIGTVSYGGIRWFERAAAEPVREFPWRGSLLSLAVAPSGKYVAAGTQEGTVRVHRLWSGEDLEMRGYPGKVTVLGWNAAGDVLSVGDADSVTSWTFRGRGPAGSRPGVLGGHGARVTAVAHSPAGEGEERLATGCADGCLRVYGGVDRAEPDRVVDLGAGVASLAWRPDGRCLAVGDAWGRVGTVEVP